MFGAVPESCRRVDVPKEPLISIVDDDASIRAALKGLMQSLGFVVESFASARDFLASDYLDRTACLIVDVNMPRMTGPELHRHLVSSGEPIPTILITAYPDDAVRARVLSAGVVGYLVKPFAENDLLACVQGALGTGQVG
jgi:FixJ family two-component response regulator